MITWVSVKDMVPDAFVSVLAYIPSLYPLPMVHEAYYANGHWHRCGIEEELHEEVTYWSPMPRGPEEK